MKPTTILINAVHAKSGGGVNYLRNMLPRLAVMPELACHVAVQRDQATLFADLVGPLPLHVLPSWSPPATVLVQEQWAIPRLAKSIGADLVFSPANYGPLWGVPSVIMLRNSFNVGDIELRWKKRLYWTAVKILSWLSFQTCRRAITVSRHACAGFLAAFGLAADSRFAVVHHGVSPIFAPPPDESGRICHRLLAVSDIYVQKNLEAAISALALLSRSVPDVTLAIAGKPLDQGYYDSLVAQAQDLGLADRVIFLGGRSAAEVADLYRKADAFVFPSLVETFGNPVLEAMASGLPVVCSNAAAMPEIAGGAALLVTPGDAAEMATAIKSLFDDRSLWQSTAERGLARAAQFSWDRTAEATAAILLAASHPSPGEGP